MTMLLSLAFLNLPSGHGAYTSAVFCSPWKHPGYSSFTATPTSLAAFSALSPKTYLQSCQSALWIHFKIPFSCQEHSGLSPWGQGPLPREEVECTSIPPGGKWERCGESLPT